MHIWMAAAENAALRGGKVGGVGDVMRDLPRALSDEGHQVDVITPSYGRFHRLPGAERLGAISLEFAGRRRRASVYRVPVEGSPVRHLVIEHPLMTVGSPGRIYHDDADGAPFATDAGRFAFFSAALVALLEGSETPPEVLHLHDWHTGPVFLLRAFDPSLGKLRSTRCVFSIHNLSYQGIRPLAGHPSSLEGWFPGLDYSVERVQDPRYHDCVNLMAVAIRLADRVNTVSPNYASEILRPSDRRRGFIGGEGLEGDLAQVESSGRLSGILNGCFYPPRDSQRPGWARLLEAIAAEDALFWGNPGSRESLTAFPRRRPRTVLLSIGRVTDQKVALFLQHDAGGQSALESILGLPGQDFAFIMLGSGDAAMERGLMDASRRHDHFLFLRGYSETLPDLLYDACDLFLMPSSFEPCGISQMLAMRSGQPCVAHAVGGLKDTIEDGVSGFLFEGNSADEQAGAFVEAVRRAMELRVNDEERWRVICETAAEQRFTWASAARNYLDRLYAN